MEILDYYSGFIKSTRYNSVNEEGQLVRETGDGSLKPIKMADKTLVLPTKAFQANPDWENCIAFHPMSESIARGESEVIHLCTSLVQASIHDWYCELGKLLLLVASDQQRQSKLTPTQQKLLGVLGKADATTLDNFNKIIAKSALVYNSGEDRRIVSLLLRRGGTVNGQPVARLFVAKFPMYEAICKLESVKDSKERKVFGIPVRVADIETLKALHHVMLPGEVDAYNYGTNSSLAPYFTALVNGYVNIVNQFNAVIRPLKKQFKHLDVIDTSWDCGEDLSAFKNRIPAMPYNEGVNPSGTEESTMQPTQQTPTALPQMSLGAQSPAPSAVTAPAMPVPQPAPQYQQQQQQPATANKPASGPISWNDLQRSSVPQQPMMQPQMMQPQMMQMQPQPVGMYQPQMMPGMMMQNPAYQMMPVMSNGMPQPPMPQPTVQQMQQPQMPMMMPQMTHSGVPNNFGMPQMMPQMMQPQMMQPQMMPQQMMGYPAQQMGQPFNFTR